MIYDNLTFNKNIVRKLQPKVSINNIFGPKVEINNSPDDTFKVSFMDKDTDTLHHSGEIGNNCWISCNMLYYKRWLIKIEKNGGEEEFTYELDLNGKSVLISFESKALGDNLSWMAYVEEFRKKHNCKVYCSTFWNHLFQLNYPEINFVSPGSVVHGITAQYRLGWFYGVNHEIDYWRHPSNIRVQPLQKAASDILGLEYKELRPLINLSKDIEKENIVSIAIHGTCQAKYWNNPNGWQKVVDYLKSIGYQVILLSKEDQGYMGNHHPTGVEKLPAGPIETVIETLQKSKLFIGIGSGLSWLSWSTGIPTCIISGFSYDYTEPVGEGVIRIKAPENSCTGCFNTHRLNPGDWNWCPVHKGTEKQFECSKLITSQMVIDAIKSYL